MPIWDLTPSENKKAGLFLAGRGVGYPAPKINTAFFFLVRKTKSMGRGPGPPARVSSQGLHQSLAWSQGLPASSWPGPSSRRPRQRPTWLKRWILACGGCDSSQLEGVVWGRSPPAKKSINFFGGCLNLGEFQSGAKSHISLTVFVASLALKVIILLQYRCPGPA